MLQFFRGETFRAFARLDANGAPEMQRKSREMALPYLQASATGKNNAPKKAARQALPDLFGNGVQSRS
jgi:hypothetical protein